MNLSHASLENPDSEGAGLKPGPHPKKSIFNPGPVLHFSYPVRSRTTPKPGPDPNFAKPNDATVAREVPLIIVQVDESAEVKKQKRRKVIH